MSRKHIAPNLRRHNRRLSAPLLAHSAAENTRLNCDAHSDPVSARNSSPASKAPHATPNSSAPSSSPSAATVQVSSNHLRSSQGSLRRASSPVQPSAASVHWTSQDSVHPAECQPSAPYQSNRNSLLGRTSSVLAFAHVVDLLTHKLTGSRRRPLALSHPALQHPSFLCRASLHPPVAREMTRTPTRSTAGKVPEARNENARDRGVSGVSFLKNSQSRRLLHPLASSSDSSSDLRRASSLSTLPSNQLPTSVRDRILQLCRRPTADFHRLSIIGGASDQPPTSVGYCVLRFSL